MKFKLKMWRSLWLVNWAHVRAYVSDHYGWGRWKAFQRARRRAGGDNRGPLVSSGVVGSVVVVAVVVAAVVAAVVYQASRDTGEPAGRVGSGVAGTVATTVTVTVMVTQPREYAEDSLPDEFYRWLDAHPGAELVGPLGGADAYAPGHHGCYAAVTDTASLVMCPDGYRADK